VLKCRLHLEDGTELGEAVYAQMVYPGETIWAAGAKKFRMLALVPRSAIRDSRLSMRALAPRASRRA
jgi:hypothetical protein